MQKENLAREILGFLKERNLKLSVAESCTGGLLSSAFVDIEGASEVFLGAFLCYSAEAKVAVAGVSKVAAMENFAVNEACSIEFAKASLERFCSDYALSTTGFAEDSKEMYLSISSKNETKTYRKNFFGNRNEIRQAQVNFVLSKFLELLGL